MEHLPCGLVALREGETDKAASLARESLANFREMDARWYLAFTLHFLGRIQAQQGELTVARSSFKESLTLCREQGEQFITPFDLEGLAAVSATQGELRWSAQLWGAAEALREVIASPLSPADRAGYKKAVRAAKAHLGEKAFAEAWQEGRRMTPAQAFAAQGRATSPPLILVASLMTPPSKPSPAELTAREVEVLRLLAQGMTNPQIAKRLFLSSHTVHAHVRSIYTKLDVNSRSSVTRYAIEQHLL